MSKSKSLTNTVLIYAIGTLSSRVISFVLVFVITFFLTKKEVGIYDIIITTVALISPFIYMQMTDAILRWMLHENKDGAITSKIFTNVVSILFISIVVFFFLILDYCPFCRYSLRTLYILYASCSIHSAAVPNLC